MTIAIIGAGRLGRAMGQGLLRQGHDVRYGVPEPARHADLLGGAGGRVAVGGVAEAIRSVDIVMMAVPFAAALRVAEQIVDWDDRILVDATNPLTPGLDGLIVGTTTSGAECLQERARGARVVKAFNSTGAANVAQPRYPRGTLAMPLAGDDARAKQRVMALATLLGFDAVDAGGLSAARWLEPLAALWIQLAMTQHHGPDFGFSRITRTP